MESINCPLCSTPMEERAAGLGTVLSCPEGHGVFLKQSELGRLSEAETDWHNHSFQRTAPMPRITPDMVAPPRTAKRARSWVESLFN